MLLKFIVIGAALLPTAHPVPPVQTPTPPPYCQFDVYRGVLNVGQVVPEEGPGYVSVVVDNLKPGIAHKVVTLHGYTSGADASWIHRVYFTYTQRNIKKARINGRVCDGT